MCIRDRCINISFCDMKKFIAKSSLNMFEMEAVKQKVWETTEVNDAISPYGMDTCLRERD